MATATIDMRLTDEQRAMVDANTGLVYGFVNRHYGGKHPKYDDLRQQPFRMELELAEAMQMPVSVFRWKEAMCWTT